MVKFKSISFESFRLILIQNNYLGREATCFTETKRVYIRVNLNDIHYHTLHDSVEY